MLQFKCRIIKIPNLRPDYKDYRENFFSAVSWETSPAEAVGGESVGEVDLKNERKLPPGFKPTPLSVYLVNQKSVLVKPGYALELYRRDDLDL